MRNRALRIMAVFSLAFILGIPVIASAENGRRFTERPAVRTIVFPGYYYPRSYWGGWGWGDPFWYSPGPYYVDTRGKIKIEDRVKTDEVYVNGSYAGTIDKADSLRVDPGSYNIKVMRNGKTLVDRDVYVVTGKKVEINLEGER